MSAEVPETWSSRDLPVLTAVYLRLNAGQPGVDPEDIRAELGMDGLQLRVALVALHDAGYLEVHLAGGWTAERAAGLITSVSERTRRELGSWPSPEHVLDQLVGALAQAGRLALHAQPRTGGARGRCLWGAKISVSRANRWFSTLRIGFLRPQDDQVIPLRREVDGGAAGHRSGHIRGQL
jgi:hypothetical protein